MTTIYLRPSYKLRATELYRVEEDCLDRDGDETYRVHSVRQMGHLLEIWWYKQVTDNKGAWFEPDIRDYHPQRHD